MDSIFVVFFAIFVYLFPTVVASRRESKRAGGVFALNLLLGWTFIGWVVALVWAFGSDVKEEADENRVACPYCKELVLRGASKCKHCGSALA